VLGFALQVSHLHTAKRGRTFELGYLIYKENACEACASGGVAKVELTAKDGAFVVSRVWRERDRAGAAP
jgi:hypothetical protein